ncbi:hypothetical protein GCM10008949_50420 [Deinococcus humi]|nr:hypothetical protein GCM10008949_50420 [Deinococcus humi]
MDYMEAGVASRDFLQQIQELAALKQTFGTLVRPFLGVDPRRPGLLALVQRAHQEQGFCGLKLYPALGFLPDDPVLYEVYAYAQEHELPVVSHCSKGGLMYQGKIPPHPVTGQTMTRMEYANYLSHPKRFIPVLKEFSELRVCLAHFGGAGEWRAFLNQSRQIPNAQTSWLDVIADMMRIYPNLYTDLSYTISDVSLMPLAKVMVNTGELRDRILFGTDFFVVRAETTEREFSIRLRGYLGETDFWHIANHNPRKFL